MSNELPSAIMDGVSQVPSVPARLDAKVVEEAGGESSRSKRQKLSAGAEGSGQGDQRDLQTAALHAQAPQQVHAHAQLKYRFNFVSAPPSHLATGAGVSRYKITSAV
jgi:hypothetical protein